MLVLSIWERRNMDIGIVGGGAIGLLFGSYLSKSANSKITLYTKTKGQALTIEDNGIVLEKKNGGADQITIHSTWIANNLKNEHQLVIIAVKQYHLYSLEKAIHSIPLETPIMFLLNGMGHIETMTKLPHHHVYTGVVEHGALKKGQNTVLHSGIGITKLSVVKGDSSSLTSFIQEYSLNDFPLEIHDKWFEMMQSKLVVNAMINPLTALYKVENGALIKNIHLHQTFKRLFEEIICILKPANPSFWWNSTMSICEKTANNRSSMLRDIENERPTEIDGILGYLQMEASKNHVKAPIVDFLYFAIKGLEKERRD
jgi:2-dehydropantoate 2-reductase